MGSTTIQVGTDTKEKLNGLKIHPRETYDDLINRLVDAAYDDEPLSDEERDEIRASEKDIAAGRVRDMREIMKDLGDDKEIQSMGNEWGIEFSSLKGLKNLLLHYQSKFE